MRVTPLHVSLSRIHQFSESLIFIIKKQTHAEAENVYSETLDFTIYAVSMSGYGDTVPYLG